jgi:Peptidase_C39 like family
VLPDHASLDLTLIPLYPQKLDQWCWAASAQMVLKYRNKDVAQCTQANYRKLSAKDCCPANPTCNKTGWPDIALERNETDYSRLRGQALSLEALEEQIAIKKNPVIFSWKWTQGKGHMMVAVGYHTVQKDVYIDILDPWAPNVGGSRKTVSYREYDSNDGHEHWDDFYDFRKKQ